MNLIVRIVAILCLLAWGIQPGLALALQETPQSIQPYLDKAIANVTEFRLDNGIKFIILERHQAPIVSFLTYADVGGVDEVKGKTGVAHFLEHLAFKGTTRIGTKDYQKEKPLLDREDALFDQIKAAQLAGKNISQLQAEFDRVDSEAFSLSKQNELGQIVEQSGGVGLNAATSSDSTVYFYSFPSNKLELWMSLESERFLDPVFREFYKEKQVILEERRLRTDNSPIGQLTEAFLGKAFTTHPYQRPVIGYDADIRNLTRQDVRDFFDTHYIPSKLTMAVVGDVDPNQIKQLAQIYFGRFQAKSTPTNSIPVEPKQTQTRDIALQFPSQPWYLEGYHRPAMNHPDQVIYELINRLLSDGRTSRLYHSLVEEKQVALSAQGSNSFPGDKYPNLMLFYALSAPNKTLDEVAIALQAELEKLKNEPVTAIELERVKTQARADLLRSLDSNMGMAQLLVNYEVKTGSWQNLFEELKAIATVSPNDIQRVASTTFTPENRTIGTLTNSNR